MDREKVIKALEHHKDTWVCNGCPYEDDPDIGNGKCPVYDDAIALLREQESFTLHDPGAICPNCKWPLYPEDHPNYCGNCGRAVKWD